MTINARMWLLAGWLTLTLAAPAFAADSFFPAFGNPGIDVRRYDLDLTVDMVPDQLNAKAELSIRATADLTSFSLDLHALDVSAVRVNGRSALFSQTEDKLTISLPVARRKGDVFQVVITYGGTVDPVADPTIDPSYGYVLGWLSTAESSYVVSEPVGASTFFPANDDLKDKAIFSFTVTVPEPYVAVANGRLTKVDDLGATRRYKFEMGQPMAAWLATVNVNKFTVTEARSRSGIKVRTYATPTTAPEAVAGFQAAEEMLPYFEAQFGNYPFRTYGSVAVDDPTLNYALETQSISVFPEGWYSEDVVAHELAHQWFGNSVSVENWEDLWLAEGFATYVEVLWPNRNDPAAFEAALAAIYGDVKAAAVGPAVVEAPDQLFTDRTYMRGVTVLYGLQLKIGQPKMIKVLKTWATLHRYGKVTTSDFIDLVVSVTGDGSLRPYLTSWIYDETVPDLPAALAAAERSGRAKAPVLAASRRGVH